MRPEPVDDRCRMGAVMGASHLIGALTAIAVGMALAAKWQFGVGRSVVTLGALSVVVAGGLVAIGGLSAPLSAGAHAR
jgi:hypothetical protein